MLAVRSVVDAQTSGCQRVAGGHGPMAAHNIRLVSGGPKGSKVEVE